MARKYMKVKKLVLSILTVALITSQLAGCATISEENLIAEANQSSQIEIEVVMPSDEIGGNSGTLEDNIVYGDSGDVEYIEDTNDVKEPVILEGDALIEYFQQVYDDCKSFFSSYTEDEKIETELSILVHTTKADNKQLPQDYEEQYRTWRDSLYGNKSTSTSNVETPPKADTTKPDKKPSGDTGNKGTTGTTTPTGGGNTSSGNTGGTGGSTSGGGSVSDDEGGYHGNFVPNAGITDEEKEEIIKESYNTENPIGAIGG